MAKNVRIAVVGPGAKEVPPEMEPQKIVDVMIEFWQNQFNQVLPDKPDLIVVPEACDRPRDFPIDKLTAYYRIRKNQVQNYFSEAAKKHECCMVYSAVREMPDGTWRNSSVLLDRKGRAAGIYNKNHVVMSEKNDGGILYGKEAPVFSCELGRIACAICFDLNFDELRMKYVKQRPQLILFSSMYHGGLMQAFWAYSCRSYFVGAICGLPCEIRNPFGEIVASTTNYRNYAVADVNLDYRLIHYDGHWEKLKLLKAHYGPMVHIHDPGLVGSVLITSFSDEKNAESMAREFDIELLDEYFERSMAHRHAPGNMEE